VDISRKFLNKVQAVANAVLSQYGFEDEPELSFNGADEIVEQLVIQFPQLIGELLSSTSKYMMLRVVEQRDSSRVSGTFLHTFYGSFDEAVQRARYIEEVSRGSISVAVVSCGVHQMPLLSYIENAIRLDEPQTR
jgi:hypothetical protein